MNAGMRHDWTNENLPSKQDNAANSDVVLVDSPKVVLVDSPLSPSSRGGVAKHLHSAMPANDPDTNSQDRRSYCSGVDMQNGLDERRRATIKFFHWSHVKQVKRTA
mgnify:CR=1 FL=1